MKDPWEILDELSKVHDKRTGMTPIEVLENPHKAICKSIDLSRVLFMRLHQEECKVLENNNQEPPL